LAKARDYTAQGQLTQCASAKGVAISSFSCVIANHRMHWQRDCCSLRGRNNCSVVITSALLLCHHWWVTFFRHHEERSDVVISRLSAEIAARPAGARNDDGERDSWNQRSATPLSMTKKVG